LAGWPLSRDTRRNRDEAGNDDRHRNQTEQSAFHGFLPVAQAFRPARAVARGDYSPSPLADLRLALATLRLTLATLWPSLAALRPTLARLRPTLATLRPALATLRPALARLWLTLARLRPPLAALRPRLARLRPPLAMPLDRGRKCASHSTC